MYTNFINKMDFHRYLGVDGQDLRTEKYILTVRKNLFLLVKGKRRGRSGRERRGENEWGKEERWTGGET